MYHHKIHAKTQEFKLFECMNIHPNPVSAKTDLYANDMSKNHEWKR